MKKLFFLFIHIFFISFLSATDYSLFKYIMNIDIDYFSGKTFNYLLDNGNIQCKEKIKFLEDKWKKYSFKNVEEVIEKSFYNENGQLIKFESNGKTKEYTYNKDGQLIRFESNGETEEYTYNKDGYLSVFNPGESKYTYISENQREYYITGRFKYRQTIHKQNDEYIVLIEKVNIKTGYSSVTRKSVYKYDGERILKYECKSYDCLVQNPNVESFYDFEYDSEKKLKRVFHYFRSCINQGPSNCSIWSFEYDEKGNITKMIYNYFDEHNSCSCFSEYSDYDEYGNWHNKKYYYNDKLSDETNRTIEYRK